MQCVIVSLLPRMREVDADGSPCLGCGDAVFMNAGEIVVIQKGTGQVVGKMDGQFCQSCHQTLKMKWVEK